MTGAAIFGTMGLLGTTAGAAIVDAAIIGGGVLKGMGAYNEGKEGRRQEYFEATESLRQAELERSRAEVAQIQGEQEEARRMRAYSQEVGSIYANAAGNGILVDSGSAGDTLGRMLDTSTKFAAQDVNTIRDNTKFTIWTHEENRKRLALSAENHIKAGNAKYKAGILGAFSAGVETAGGLAKASMMGA